MKSRILDRLVGGDAEQRFTWDDYVSLFSFNGAEYLAGGGAGFTWNQGSDEKTRATFHENCWALMSVAPVAACISLKMRVFAQARYIGQRISNGRPGELFAFGGLDVVEQPSPNMTTGEWHARRILDIELAGNNYEARVGGRFVRLRPDWVTIVVDSPSGELGDPESMVAGYAYKPGGWQTTDPMRVFTVDEVAHWSPFPDPLGQFVGAAPISALLREIRSDSKATDHKANFFDNAATPNLMVTAKEPLSKEQAEALLEGINRRTSGPRNAGKTLFLNGADVSVVGADMRKMDFKSVQGAGESRIAAALGTPAGLVGLSEGMAANTYSNLSQARRVLTDATLSYYWQSVCAATSKFVQIPEGGRARLWYDVRDIPFLQDDAEQAAETGLKQATTIRTLVDAGYTAESAVAAVAAGNDWTMLEHSGLFSVQLQKPAPDAGVPADVA